MIRDTTEFEESVGNIKKAEAEEQKEVGSEVVLPSIYTTWKHLLSEERGEPEASWPL